MQWPFSKALLCASFLLPVLGVLAAEKAGGVKDPDQVALQEDESKVTGLKDTKDTADGSTSFNGLRVPPFPMLDGEKLKAEIEDGYW